jgi:hypothetical protein
VVESYKTAALDAKGQKVLEYIALISQSDIVDILLKEHRRMERQNRAGG